MGKKVVIAGSGLGSLSVALRLASRGFDVTILEKYHRAGGRLNLVEEDGFSFDAGPTFMSMSYELRELFDDCGIEIPLKLIELDPLYKVFFKNRKEPFTIYRDLDKLEREFFGLEPGLKEKAEKYLKRGADFFHDTEKKVIKSNFNSLAGYLATLTTVPMKHLPYMFRSMWSFADRIFESEEAKIIFTLVAFFLGSTPFKTPAIYSMLSYTELKHDGYWKFEGGMYNLVNVMISLLNERNVTFHYNTEVTAVEESQGKVTGLTDREGRTWKGDIFIINADAAQFRGEILKRKKFRPQKLDAMKWTMAPFTIYMGLDKKLDGLLHHNYFLGDNFKQYTENIFTTSENPDKPYYYVNVPSKSYPAYAPAGMESLMILCPVPDLRYKSNWDDARELADSIVEDLSERIDTDIAGNSRFRKILTPIDWRDSFNLYRGSGLGLSHDMLQVGAFRPRNKDERFKNLYYVGASTQPGTGLPMVIIGSKLIMERIENEF